MNAPALNIANALTLMRLVLVPAVIVAIGEARFGIAFTLFVVAGLSDALDGFIARRYDLRTAIGAYLDPIADKLLLVSIYVALAIVGALPFWLAVLVVSRDVLIVGAVIVAWLVGKPLAIKPIGISKANTVAQIALAASVLAGLGFGVDFSRLVEVLTLAVVALTLASIGAYFARWYRHVAG